MEDITPNNQEIYPMNSLEKARLEVSRENPDLPMQLKFEVSSPETIEKLLSVDDLTMPTKEGQERNIVGKIYDQVVEKLTEHDFPNIEIVRGDPIVDAKDNFDSLLFSPGNPGRSSTYTRYTDENQVLRTHTSALIPSTFKSLEEEIDNKTFVLPGLVYRRDVIDPRHLDVFHQIDVWTLQKNSTYGKVNRENLLELARTVFEAACPDAEMVVLEAKHPYTIEGIEVYAKVGNKEIEVFEAGLAHPQVLVNSGINPEEYSGLALGMGVERLIMARKNLPDIRLIRSTDPRVIKQMTNMEKFKNVSDKPAISRDMSYCVDKNDTEEDICEQIRDIFGDRSDLLEEVKILERTPYDKLTSIAKERLGAQENQDNVLVRIVLRHPDKTLTKKESADLYSMAYPKLHQGITKGYEVK
jgi:phenylalanyl-tRNA synthetase alpha chain